MADEKQPDTTEQPTPAPEPAADGAAPAENGEPAPEAEGEAAAAEAAPAQDGENPTAPQDDSDDEDDNLQYIQEIFSRDVRIRGVDHELFGEGDDEAYRKLHHIINTARRRHTLRVLDEPQLTGVLALSKPLQKVLKDQQSRWHKAAERAQKLAKKENANRDDEIKKVEKRLEKELAAFKTTLEAENKNHPPEYRMTSEALDDMARRLKWRSWLEYDRVITAFHLDNMKHIYRLRMLDMLPCYENIQIAEWVELHRVEEEEYVQLEKKHGIEVKRLTSNLRWGKFVLMMKGEKEMDDGQKVKKAEFAEYSKKRSEAMTEAQRTALDELKLQQADRRRQLREQQKVVMDAVVAAQEAMLFDLRLDETAGSMSTDRVDPARKASGISTITRQSEASVAPLPAQEPAATETAPAESAESEAPKTE